MPNSTLSSGSASTTFISLKGEQEPASLMLEDISRTGVNGTAVRKLQNRAEPFEMIGIKDYTSIAAALADYTTLRGLRGKLVSVTDDYGTAASNLILWDVVRERLAPILVAAGGTQSSLGQALMVVRFRLQQTS